MNKDKSTTRTIGKIGLAIILAVLAVSQALAQKTCVIASAENHVPIREALVHTDNNHWARTDYRGYWTMKYSFDSATVSKPGYLKTTVYLKELPDTLFMIPESHQLGTVEVWGQGQEHVKRIEKQAKDAAANTPRQVTLGFDLANMLDKRKRRDYKHLKKANEIIGEMDKKDPIIAAYEQATGKKVLRNPSGDVQKPGEETEE